LGVPPRESGFLLQVLASLRAFRVNPSRSSFVTVNYDFHLMRCAIRLVVAVDVFEDLGINPKPKNHQ
jgi:hypothetical protein